MVQKRFIINLLEQGVYGYGYKLTGFQCFFTEL